MDIAPEITPEVVGPHSSKATDKKPEKTTPLFEVKKPQEKLKGHIEFARKSVDALVEYAVANGIPRDRFAHLAQVWQEDAYRFAESAKDLEILNLLPGSHGFVMANDPGAVVVIRDEHSLSNHSILHESIHRASYLGIVYHQLLNHRQFVAAMHGFEIRDDGLLILDESEKASYRSLSAEEKDAYFQNNVKKIQLTRELLMEGITEWATQRVNGMKDAQGNEIIMTGDVYKFHTDVMGALIEALHKKQGIDKEKIEAMFIDIALTGDLSKLITEFKGLPMEQLLTELYIDLEAYKKEQEQMRQMYLDQNKAA